MNDYKELIETLRICSNNRLKDNAYFNMVSAADAIEQLVKERDALKGHLKLMQDCERHKAFVDEVLRRDG